MDHVYIHEVDLNFIIIFYIHDDEYSCNFNIESINCVNMMHVRSIIHVIIDFIIVLNGYIIIVSSFI